jgi:pimeloyl-ACP methyl ester carboxylesterase
MDRLADRPADTPPPSVTAAIESLTDGIVDTIVEVRRRADDHFSREPLLLPDADEPLLEGAPACTARSLVRAVAAAADVPTRDGHGTPEDAVSRLLRLNLQHAGAATRRLADVTVDWRERASMRVQARLAGHRAAPAPRFHALRGLRRRAATGGVHYLVCGNGPETLLLVNAFGLTLDVWHDLVQSLPERFTVLAIDDGAAPGPAPGVPRTCYATPDSLPRFTDAVRRVLQAQGRRSCHVASWCSGAKFAIELARALPGSIASLSLFSPSFAGTPAAAGSDSAYETSLHTMCKLVERMPQAADSMARSMLALMKKGETAAASSVFELPDTVALPWLHAPFSSAGHMIEYSRQLLNFRAHRLVGPAGGEALDLPVMLVTGEMDRTTCAVRAREICRSLCPVLSFELRCASHYFIHQNSALVARLLDDFVTHRLGTQAPHPRLARAAVESHDALVSGEI